MSHPQHLIEMRRNAAGPGLHMPSGVIIGADLQAQINQLFPGLRVSYEHGFGYVLLDGNKKVIVLIGGRYNDFEYIRQWIQWQQPKAIVIQGFWDVKVKAA